MTRCQIEERAAGRPYPRTCPTCGLTGPCAKGLDRKSLIAALSAKEAEIAKLTAERDEALRRRDAWKARAENHVEIVNALRAKTAGKDSRTLSRALLGAAFAEAESRAEAAEARVKVLEDALRAFRDAAEARAADAPEWKDTDTVSIVVTIRDLRAALEGEK